MASFLRSPWLLHILTTIVFLVTLYGIARGGRELDKREIWEWKRRDMEAPEELVTIFLGLEWKDIVWGLLAVAGIGTVISEFAFNLGSCLSAVGTAIAAASGLEEFPRDVSFYQMAMLRVLVAIIG